MRIEISTADARRVKVDGLLVFTGEDVRADLRDLDALLKGSLGRCVARQKYRGKPGDVLVFDTHGAVPADVIILAGRSDDGFKMRRSYFLAMRRARDAGVRTLAVRMGDASPEAIETAVEMAFLSLYAFTRYKKADDQRKEIDVVRLLVARKDRAAERAARSGEILARAACYARDLVNEPAGVVTPGELATRARALARASRGAVTCEVHDRKWMERQGMGGLLAVARGSRQEPRFIVLRYKGRRPSVRAALVGKGITFDSGGLCIKTMDQMSTMKCDMSGAATVLGVFSALPLLAPHADIIGVIPATENMPGGAAYKPGDILRMMNGKTVEIFNTDAEGRLILADALAYAARQKPDWIIDLATLTGAVVIALGDLCTGLMGSDPVLIGAIRTAAAGAGERAWELPLIEEYRETLKSDIADLKNSNYGRDGGAIKAGLFLREFVSDVTWVHMDIAGPAFLEKEQGSHGKGATGHGVGTLLRLLRDYGPAAS